MYYIIVEKLNYMDFLACLKTSNFVDSIIPIIRTALYPVQFVLGASASNGSPELETGTRQDNGFH